MHLNLIQKKFHPVVKCVWKTVDDGHAISSANIENQ